MTDGSGVFTAASEVVLGCNSELSISSQRNIALLATPSFWTGLVMEAQCSSSSRALAAENREGREPERSIDGSDVREARVK